MLRDGYQCLTIPRSGAYRFEVIGARNESEPGARIIGEVRLEKGEKITVALGQTGSHYGCGTGGTFVVKENSTSDPQPLFVAAGAGSAGCVPDDFSKASLTQTASGNDKIGSSGVQIYFDKNQNSTDSENGSHNDIYCGGAGFWEGPVTGELREDSVAPKSYKDGLIGGKGIDEYGDLAEGGFGGGGASYYRNGLVYYGAGGGYTGGGIKIYNDEYCDGGGGGSFSIDDGARSTTLTEITENVQLLISIKISCLIKCRIKTEIII